MGAVIRIKWLEQYYLPTPIPDMHDAYSGDPVLFITDHYRVKDWDALTQSMATQSDMDGDRAAGWNRIIECEDGQLRSSMSINIESQPDRISVFYKTQKYADDGRPWLESLTHDSLQYLTREITNPKGAMANLPDQDDHSDAFAYPSDMVPDDLDGVFAQVFNRLYANWADEPLPILGNKTPRESIQTEAGLERVKGLLRDYEENEIKQARQQGRNIVSFDFLWDALGIGE